MVVISVQQAVAVVALLCVGVVYGTDVFFALVGQTALRRTDAASLTQVLGHLHAVADRRMPVVGALGVLSTVGLALTAGPYTWAGRWALLALLGLLGQLTTYLTVAKPVNQVLTTAAQQGASLPNALLLQQRWNSVIGWRAAALTWAMVCLLVAVIQLE